MKAILFKNKIKCMSQIFPSYTLGQWKIFNFFKYNFIDNSRKCDWKKWDFSKTMKNQFFHSHFLKYLWWKMIPSQIFQKVWVEKLILHRFWKIPLFPVILSWIIYDNEQKSIKYLSLTKSIRRENLILHTFCRIPLYPVILTWIIYEIV